MVYSLHSVPSKSEFQHWIARSWRSTWMSYPHTFHCYSVSIFWTVSNSLRTTFSTSCKLHIMVGQCPSLVSMGPLPHEEFEINLFTNWEIIKLNRHFKHPASEKLYEVMKRARPNRVYEATRQLLEKITKACEICQIFSAPPQRFRVSLPPSDIVFEREVPLDLMWWNTIFPFFSFLFNFS